MDSIKTPALAYEQQEEIIVQPKAPWLQTNGKHTPDKHLKTLTPDWDEKTWKRYLSWLDEREKQTLETLTYPKKYDKICEDLEESIFVNAESGANTDLRDLVTTYLESLTPRQKQVLEIIFWKGRSELYVAEKLGIKQQAVNRLKKRALNKIKHLVTGGCCLPYMRGEDFIFLISKGEENGKQLSNIEDPFAKEAC